MKLLKSIWIGALRLKCFIRIYLGLLKLKGARSLERLLEGGYITVGQYFILKNKLKRKGLGD